jgi:hypothetical protein
MQKIKVLLPALVFLLGVSIAFATKPEESKDKTSHNWVDENNTLIFIGTTASAEAACPGDSVFCLRASDSPWIVVKQAI